MKLLILLFVVVGCALAYPRTYNTRRYIQPTRLQAGYLRPRRAPIHRAMLIHGYYRPYRTYAQRRQGFEPETSMTAFAAGDTVAAGSYLGSKLGPNCISCDPQGDLPQDEFVALPEADPAQFEAEKPLGDYPEAPVAPVGLEPIADEEAAVEPVRPVTSQKKRKPNKIPQEVVDSDDDDNDDNVRDSLPIGRTRGTNSYFPIVMGGYPGSRAANGGGGGGVTAIANSYSTGKGGVATSHATAYGGAPPKSKKNAPSDDED